MNAKDTTRLIVLVVALAILFSLWAGGSISAAPNAAGTLHKERVTVTTSGNDGSATGSATTSAVIVGQVMRIDVNYGASLTTTTDITITQANETVSAPIVVKADSATDATYYPSVILTDNGGTARTYDGTRPVVIPFPVADQLTVNLAQTTAATPAVTIDIYWKE